jgi:hypothetical protein
MRGLIGRRLGGSSTAQYGVRLIQPGAIAGGGLVTFSRAQAAGAVSTAFAADGVTLEEYGADAPRFNGTARRMLFGGQRTNAIRNPRAHGAVAGTPGTPPTNWSISLANNGISSEIVGGGTENGVPGFYLRFFGTATANALFEVTPEPNFINIPGSVGQIHTHGIFHRLTAGSLSGFSSINLEVLDRGGAGTPGTTLNITPSAGLARSSLTRTITEAGTTGITFRCNVRVTSGATVDATIFFGAPQSELGSFASTPILPPIGTPGASTRGQDNLTASFGTLFPSGVGTVLASVMIPTQSPVSQHIFALNLDATNRIIIFNPANTNNIVLNRSILGATTSIILGAHTLGTLFRAGMTFDGATITGNFDGGTNQALAGQPGGLTTLRVGADGGGAFNLFGEVGYLDTLPYVIPPANLPAAVAAIPS